MANNGQECIKFSHGILNAVNRSLDLKQVLSSLNQKGIATTVDDAKRCFLVVPTQICIRCMAQRWKLRSRSQGTNHETPHAVSARPHLISHFPSHCSALVGKLTATISDVIIRQVRQVATKSIGLNQVSSRLKVGAVNLPQHIRAGVVENLITPLQIKEILFHVQVKALELGAHGAVADQHMVCQRIQKFGGMCVVVGW